jgi:lysophospholipase L1-like esterase
MDDFSLCALADALTSGDWSVQDKAVKSFHELYLPRLAEFKALDFNKVSYLALEYGVNDFTLGMPIGASSDTTPQTYKGSLNYSIRKLQAAFPLLRLFLIAPAYKLNVEELDSDVRPNPSGLFLKDYVDATVEIAALNHIPCLDMWRTLGLGFYNYKGVTFDGTHPNQAGAIRRGEAIAAFISSVFEPK